MNAKECDIHHNLGVFCNCPSAEVVYILAIALPWQFEENLAGNDQLSGNVVDTEVPISLL
jgi:hypothetical protein